ncbi:SGNH/GDSL hydrolase family protein [Boseongicola aestuarii]|uniref:SGNH hydrolase-type esterase domain-containing protein n=1 Tax=Boseongicola aestuarii TaxID=1470561 RepID=A0A238J271_9RHOB|nr:SGNH/GDSL hydrolase family protein [Boseongicola aestuarii]SMX24060.1 hypothetical protein BOA8489_02175 [Boseongicola aestuarii]
MKLNADNEELKPQRFFLIVAIVASLSGATFAKADETPSGVAGQTWDYVALGGSIGAQWMKHYGALIESDLSVEIVYYDHSFPFQKVSALREKVTGEPNIREDIVNAEVITIGVGFADMRPAITLWGSERKTPDSEGMNGAIHEFCLAYDAMLSEVVSLAAPTTIVQIMDFYFPYVEAHRDMGIYESTKQDWKRFNECIATAGSRHGVAVAQVHKAFNGPLGDDDPAKKGYLDSGGKHSSEEGMQVIAEEFRRLGYLREPE